MRRTQLPLLDYIVFGQGTVAGIQGDHQRAARLLAAAETGVKNDSFWLDHAFVDSFDQDIAVLRDQLGESAFAEAWAKGKAMTREQVIKFALDLEASNRAADH
jgi:hypothetical protein